MCESQLKKADKVLSYGEDNKLVKSKKTSQFTDKVDVKK